MEYIRIIKTILASLISVFVFFIVLHFLFIELGKLYGLEPAPTPAGSIPGIVFILAGIGSYFYSFYMFVKKGKGTPVPYNQHNTL